MPSAVLDPTWSRPATPPRGDRPPVITTVGAVLAQAGLCEDDGVHIPRVSVTKPFDYSRDVKRINFREHPELYQVGRGEQGVLRVEPYKSEILPHWRFRTPAIAQESARTIYALFLAYKEAGDFVGMDMARKFLQMGYTRSRRYANHRTGRKYDPATREVLPREADWQTNDKAESARIFYAYYAKAKEDAVYLRAKLHHQQAFG